MIRLTVAIFAIFIQILLVAQSASADHGVSSGTLQFAVELDGNSIGEHVIMFHQLPEDSIEVDIRIDLQVKFGPFTMFNYTHQNNTTWHAGRLVRMQSETDDDGRPFSLHAVARSTGLSIESSSLASYTAPPETLPTTYWMSSTVKQTRLINTQNGEFLEIRASELGSESVTGPNGLISATRYQLDGDLQIDLWYDDDETLVKLAFESRGGKVIYRLVSRSGVTTFASTSTVARDRK